MKAYRRRDAAGRISALKLEAERQPDGHARYFLAIALWEEHSLAEAHQIAMPFLEDSPEDFHLLAICLSHYIAVDDAQHVDEFARRLAMARNPAKLERTVGKVLDVLLLPLRLLGFRGLSGQYQDVLDAWSDWAREYVRVNPLVENKVPSLRGGEHAAPLNR